MSLRVIEATYSSRCGLCDDVIKDGDDIVQLSGEWVHADCAEDEGAEVDR
jgi:hypothetical protein